jgi:uncharacterized protein (TIGR03067 family)
MLKSLKKALGFGVFLQWIPLLCGVLLLGCKTVEPKIEPLTILQGKWVGDTDGQEVSVTIKDRNLYFFRDNDFWFETTLTINNDVYPNQLRATIERTTDSQESAIGKSVPAIYKVEGDTLTMLAFSDEQDTPPENFDGSDGSLYELIKSGGSENDLIEGPIR